METTFKPIITKIAGTSYTQEAIKKLKLGQTVQLVREPDNKFDTNAIRIQTSTGEKLGYIAKKTKKGSPLAEELAPKIDSGLKLEAEILGVTGEGKGTYGCNIAIKEGEEE